MKKRYNAWVNGEHVVPFTAKPHQSVSDVAVAIACREWANGNVSGDGEVEVVVDLPFYKSAEFVVEVKVTSIGKPRSLGDGQ